MFCSLHSLLSSVNIEGKLPNGTTFLDFGVEELDFTLGQGECQQHAIVWMKRGR
jgi:hypothetical protein